MPTLICSACKQELDVSNFSKKTGSKRGFHYKCKTCHNKYMREEWYPKNSEKQIKSSNDWKKRNNAKVRAYQLKVCPLKAEEVLSEANGVCQICGKEPEVLCIDHDHKTQEIRGCLCKHCNSGLGFFGDNINLLRKAIKYLNRGSTK